MQQLVQYITSLKCNNTFDILKILQNMEHDNRVFQYNPDTNTILLDGDWWSNFIETHTQGEPTNIMRSLHNMSKAKYLKLISRDVTPANFAWDDTYQMYVCSNGGWGYLKK